MSPRRDADATTGLERHRGERRKAGDNSDFLGYTCGRIGVDGDRLGGAYNGNGTGGNFVGEFVVFFVTLPVTAHRRKETIGLEIKNLSPDS